MCGDYMDEHSMADPPHAPTDVGSYLSDLEENPMTDKEYAEHVGVLT
jgi:hypothetical protein